MFSQTFWTHDYSSGVQVLLEKLSQGFTESGEFLGLVASRIDSDRRYAEELANSAQQAMPGGANGFAFDSGALLRVAFEETVAETAAKARRYSQIAEDLQAKIYDPFTQWNRQHTARIKDAESRLRKRLSGYQNLLAAANKRRVAYLDKSQRQLSSSDKLEPVASTIRIFREKWVPSASATETVDPMGVTTLAGLEYTHAGLAELLGKLLRDVVMSSYRVPLFGNYQNVSSGAAIASSTRRLLKNDSIAYSEKFGQSLIDHGLLRPVGQISNKFQSAHSSHYQWQPPAFNLVGDHPDVLAEIQDPDRSLPQTPKLSLDELKFGSAAPAVPAVPPPAAVEDPFSENATLASSSTRDPPLSPDVIAESEQYIQSVIELDLYRCDMELEIQDIYDYLEKCERDRREALKQALCDFAVVTMRSDQDRTSQLRLFSVCKEVDVEKELHKIVSDHGTGPLVPNVTTYRATNNSICQTFGVEIEDSLFFVNITLNYLSSADVPLDAWTKRYDLRDVYKLRSQLNTGRKFNAASIYKFFPLEVVVGIFKQFLLELPESLIPFTVYDKVKELYDPAYQGNHQEELTAILMHVPKASYCALEQLLPLLAAYDQHENVARAMAPYIIRPRAVSAVTQQDQQPTLFVQNLLAETPELFSAVAKNARPTINVHSLNGTDTPRRVVSSPVFWSPHKGRSDTPSSSRSSTPSREISGGTSLLPLSLNQDPAGARKTPRASTGSRGLGILPIGDSDKPLISRKSSTAGSVSSPTVGPAPGRDWENS